MDLFRTRAIPALIGAALALPCAAADDCKALNGTYQEQSVAPRNGVTEHLSNFVMGKEKNKLFHREAGTGDKPSFSGSATLSRPKVTALASSATLTHDAKGTRLKFMDAQGKDLAEAGIDSPRWKCSGSHLARTSQRTSGLGDVFRTERIEEKLLRDPATGDLVYIEAKTVVEPPGGKPTQSEAHFRQRK
jgi:hypothetical protein